MPSIDPRVDAYIREAPPFARPILEHLRASVHAGCPEAVETIKWRMPFFVVDGHPLAFMAAFKTHCGFGFWKRRAEGDDEGMRQFGRITCAAELPGRREIAALVRQAVEALHLRHALGSAAKAKATRGKAAAIPSPQARGGREHARVPIVAEPAVPPALAAALAQHPRAEERFAAMPPSHRREYAEWIAEAKREATRERRVAEAIAWLAEGKPRNWKYEAERKAAAR